MFDGLDPDKVIELLKKEVKNEAMHFTSSLVKNVPASYRTWNSLNGKQQIVVEQIYAGLSGKNKAILKNAIEELSTKTTIATTPLHQLSMIYVGLRNCVHMWKPK